MKIILSALSMLSALMGLACLLALVVFAFTGNLERAMLAFVLLILCGLACALLDPKKGVYRYAR